MGLFSKMTGKMAKGKGDKRAKKQNSHHSHRQEYLLNDNTPFDVTEAFRNLKAALSVSVAKRNGGTAIMATSAYPEDGKTTVTANLAVMFALSDAKVVLVDADIRKGRVAKYFKHKSAPGLSDCLSGQNTLDEVVHQSHVNPNLSYITCGTHSPKPYELLESNEMKELLIELRARYDYVIIDTPPVLLISDALALATVVDGTVLVCRHQVSYVSDINRALNTLQFAKANVLGVVVNDYKAPSTGKFYGGYKKYYYYNSYGYGYGSTNPEEKDADEIEALPAETTTEAETAPSEEAKETATPVETEQAPTQAEPTVGYPVGLKFNSKPGTTVMIKFKPKEEVEEKPKA